MDVKDGAILTMVSQPPDPNEYYKSDVKAFKNWRSRIFMNRVRHQAFERGDRAGKWCDQPTFKILT